MLTRKEIDYVRISLIRDVTNPQKRSKIMFVADQMAREAGPKDDYDDVYWSVVGYFLDPKNDEDLESDFRELGGSLTVPPQDTSMVDERTGLPGEPVFTLKLEK